MEQQVLNEPIPDTLCLERAIKVEYVNWRKECTVRAIVPIKIYWGKTQWHPEEQWLLQVWDVNRGAYREYALRDIKAWL